MIVDINEKIGNITTRKNMSWRSDETSSERHQGVLEISWEGMTLKEILEGAAGRSVVIAWQGANRGTAKSGDYKCHAKSAGQRTMSDDEKLEKAAALLGVPIEALDLGKLRKVANNQE